MQAAACGELHTALLAGAGEVYTFGCGEFGVLGHGSEERALLPRRVEALVGEPLVAVACGWRHTAALSAHSQLYTWGHGGAGQLGHGGTIHFFLPLRLQPPPGGAAASALSLERWVRSMLPSSKVTPVASSCCSSAAKPSAPA